MRKKNYIVAFKGDGECVYGKDEFSSQFECDIASYIQPMTILQAIKQLKTLSGKKVIYKLVEINPEKEKFKQKIRNQMMVKK